VAPVDVSGLSSGVAAVAAGWQHTCALQTGGGVKCWGHGEYGQLGNGVHGISLTPVDVVGLSGGVVALTTRGQTACALTSAGGVKCWGRSYFGELACSYVPVDVVGLGSGVTAITAGGSHACALTAAGGVKCWGANAYGQLGDGTLVDRYAPVDVVGLAGPVTAITAGGTFTCGLLASGRVQCWGSNAYGQLAFSPGWRPVAVLGFEGYRALLPLMHR
jgi:alpha-tubulin suppressor-like RCC1 family protein